MKTIYRIVLCICTCFSITYGEAQNAEAPGIVAVEEGLFVYAGGLFPKNGHYLVERKGEKDRKYAEITKIKVPNRFGDMDQKIAKAETHFRHLIPLSTKNKHSIFEYIQSNAVDDSLYRSEHLPVIAIAAGTAYLDTEVKKNEEYQYRLTLFKDGNQISQRELKPIKNIVKTDLPTPKILQTDIVNDAVFMEWVVPEQKDITLFNVYRAFFGTNDFKKITPKKGYTNSAKGLHLIAIDTSTEKSSLYKYYIQSVDLYGNAGEISDVITTGKLADEHINPISALKTEELEGHQIKLSWTQDKSAIISNIQVFRSDNFDDGFKEIMNLPPAITEYIDIVPEANENFYYYLKITGGTGQEFISSKVTGIVKHGSDLPGLPREITAIPTKKGVEIRWEFDEPHTHGFYVYRADVDTERFSQISNLIPANGSDKYVFKDENETLKAGAMYRYFVRAENDVYKLGNSSDTIHAFTGKETRINSPLDLKAVYRDSVVELYWKDLSTQEGNLLGYKVYRNDSKNPLMQKMSNDTLKSYKNYYIDNQVSKGEEYSYQVTAIDVFGAESPKSIKTTITIPAKRKITTPNKPIVFKNSKGINISWNQIASDHIDKINIYRSEDRNDAKVIKTLSIDQENNFLDTNVEEGKLYYYKIAFITKKGNESNRSKSSIIYY